MYFIDSNMLMNVFIIPQRKQIMDNQEKTVSTLPVQHNAIGKIEIFNILPTMRIFFVN